MLIGAYFDYRNLESHTRFERFKVDELIQECVGLVSANGGTLNYRDLLAAIAPEKRPNLPRSLKQARASGLLTQEVSLVDGVVTHVYKTV